MTTLVDKLQMMSRAGTLPPMLQVVTHCSQALYTYLVYWHLLVLF